MEDTVVKEVVDIPVAPVCTDVPAAPVIADTPEYIAPETPVDAAVATTK